MADTRKDTRKGERDLRKEQRDTGKEARKVRTEAGDTMAATRSRYRAPSSEQWIDYAEQEAGYAKQTQAAAARALAASQPAPVEAPAHRGTSGGSGGGSSRKTTSRSTGYTGAVDTEIPVGVLAPEHLDTGGIDYMDPPWNESSDTPGAAGVSEPTRGTAAAEVEGGPAGKHYEGVSGGLSMARDEFNKAYSQAVERAGLTAQELPPHHDVFKKTAWQMVKDSEQLGETVYLPDTGAWLQDLVAAGYGEFADAFEVEIQAVKAHEAEK
tara:strand:- start:3948 stop:4751 length:804 start_codon:yes stop_codon:yes gene_type:complete